MLMQQRSSTADGMVDATIDFLIEMKSIEYEEVLDMPSVVFDMFLQGFKRRADAEKKAMTKAPSDTHTFG
jgi:hypothetical protein